MAGRLCFPTLLSRARGTRRACGGVLARAAVLAAVLVSAGVLPAQAHADPPAIGSDEFNGFALDPSLWTFVNPLGDASLTMTGSHAEISVPAGTRHDLWGSTDEVPRLMQAAPNTDFEVELKWDSAVSSPYQLQGLVVAQDAATKLRIETHHDGDGTKLFVAALAGGSGSVLHYGSVAGGAPVYFRLSRAGNAWTLRTSANGISWAVAASFTYALSVSSIGPFAGNSGGSPPAFTSRIDYFRRFVPDTNPPSITSITASASGIGAVVSWQTDEPANASVAYGTDTSYAGGMVANPALTSAHSVGVENLACGTLYHFQVRSRDAAGNEAVSPDQTFTTATCPSVISSDEFNGPLDSGVWTYVNPVGDATLTMTGSHAEFSLPAGVRHDLWTNASEVPRLLQAAPNSDFEVELKWDSAVSAQYQLQGLVVVQDSDDLLRIETHYDGGGTRLFVARISGGSAAVVHNSAFNGAAPLYFRLKRTGNAWVIRSSSNGDSWETAASFSEALAVTAIGPFAGNSGGSPPAFTSRVDYFRDVPPDLTPPAITAIGSSATGAVATVTWTTNEPATSEVRHGSTTAYEAGAVTRDGFRHSHSIVLHGLACGSTYHFQVRSRDAAGNEAASADRTLTTSSCPAAVSSDEFNTAALDTSLWTFVDPVGDSSLGMTGSHANISVPAGVRHDLWTGVDEVPRLLQAAPNGNFEVEVKYDSVLGARYQLQGIVVEQDTVNMLRIEVHHDSLGAHFFVASIAGGSASTVESRPIPNFTSPVYLRVSRVGDTWNARYSFDGEAWVGSTFTRALNVTAIGPYAGNSGPSPPAFTGAIDYFREKTDRTPPVVSLVETSPRSTSAVVTWTTDEPADSDVSYGTTTAYGSTRSSAKLETRHSVTLAGLTCSTVYHFRVRSRDANANATTTSDATFTTTPCTPTGGPDIDVWNGASQTFGTVGIPQTWVNILGNVSDTNGVGSLTASLNGSPSFPLGIGPDGWRLERAGDFNVELNHSSLLPGANDLVIKATDTLGHVTERHVTVNWQGVSGGASPATNGPVLVVAAHPDDEALGQAGIISAARAAGRRVYVAIVTNGDLGSAAGVGGECNAPGSAEQQVAAYGLERNAETKGAMELLGLSWSANLASTEIIFLGYPDGRVDDLATMSSPWDGDASGLHRTYAEDFDGNVATCNGDFRHRLSGTHSPLSASAMAADFDALLALAKPTDIYTHAWFDGHDDHAETYYQVISSVKRTGTVARVHSTIEHPEGSSACMPLSSARWPNPELQNNDPFARFTPFLDFLAPPAPICSPSPTGPSWGPIGAPNELVEVPVAMQGSTEATNLKWRAIEKYETQIDCSNPSEYHVNCGYMRAFVKRHEFFWQWLYGTTKLWPTSYTTSWTSDASIGQQAQVIDGQWRFDGNGVRPLATGFDRLITLGDRGWKNYEVTVPVTLHSADATKSDAGVGVALGWQGHNAWDQPKKGHPTGGLCMYVRPQPEPNPFRLQIGYSPGPTDDTTVATGDYVMGAGMQYTLRFRQQRVVAGSTRYSCKVWRSDKSQPSEWTIVADIPDWAGETDQHPGSAVLVAHNVDATFGDVTITSLP
jgi:LmbE family N-acetylglucosaminyl deacetylase/regulation of enolase protein 1 (concanavalin A-like superfamily)